jgi:hypothetical protein
MRTSLAGDRTIAIAYLGVPNQAECYVVSGQSGAVASDKVASAWHSLS